MKKRSKYLLTGISLFCALSTTLSAATIKETPVNGDGYDTINAFDMILGITRFNGSTVVTGTRVAKASTNDSMYFYKENGSLDNYQAPILYVYNGPVGGWYSLDDNNDPIPVTDSALLEKLENSKIYYVDNIEKKLEVDVKDINIDDSNLPDGVTLKDEKLLVNATLDSFEISTTDGQKVSYIKNEGKFIMDYSKYYTVDASGFITNYTGLKGKVEIPSKINDVNIVGIRSGAFDNKGIIEVIVPESIMTIESNAFSNNELTSVLINEKYDKGDFTSLADDAFGTFTDIKYNNDLTRYISAFKDELTLNVQKDVDITSENGHFLLSDFASKLEKERLGISLLYSDEGVSGANMTSIESSMQYKDENTLILKAYKFTGSQRREVSKEVKYNVNKVDSNSSDISNIAKATKEYEEYYNNVKDNLKNDTSIKLFDLEKVYEIFGKYNINCTPHEYGDGGEEIIIKDGINIYEDKFPFIVSSSSTKILYGTKDIITQQWAVYGFDLENTYDTEDEYHAAILKAFEDATNVKDYLVYDGSYQTYMKNNKKCTSVYIKDNRNGNMWGIEARTNYDETSAYNVDSEGFITSYSGIGGELIIPSKVGDTNIVGIRSNAFAGNNINAVVIPESIMTIESKAFPNYVRATIEGKYDKGDFTSLAEDAFKERSYIVYSNDLTKALDKFKDELTLNVQKDVDLTKELSHISLGNFAVMNEVSRINDSNIAASFILTGDYGDGDGEDSQVEHTMYAEMEYKTNDTFNLTLAKIGESHKSVTKTVKYSINKVDGDSSYIKKINDVVKTYSDEIDNIKENFANDLTLKLPTYDSVNKLIKDNNLKTIVVNSGGKGEIKLGNILLSQYYTSYAMYLDEVLYDSYDFENLVASYEFNDDASNYNSEDEVYNHIINVFKTKSGITNYEINDHKFSYSNVINKAIYYSMSLKDKDSGNEWYIQMTSDIPNDFVITSSYETQYFPNLNSEDYSSTEEWINAAIEKFKEKSGISDVSTSSFELVTNYNGNEVKYNADSDGNYNYVYQVTVQSPSTQYPWKIYLYKTTKTKVEEENYEATKTDYTDAINELVQAKSLTNYKAGSYGNPYYKDGETGKFNLKDKGTKYIRYSIYDLDTDKVWYLFIKATN